MAKPWTGWSTSATNSTRPDRNEHMSHKEVWFIGLSLEPAAAWASISPGSLWRHGLL